MQRYAVWLFLIGRSQDKSQTEAEDESTSESRTGTGNCLPRRPYPGRRFFVSRDIRLQTDVENGYPCSKCTYRPYPSGSFASW